MGENFGNHSSDKGLMYKIYKKLIQLSRKKQFIKKNEQRNQTDILPKKTHKGPKYT